MQESLGPIRRPDDGPERRAGRPSQPDEALARLLEGARRDGNFEALALADEAGILVAGAGAYRACEEIAAFAPIWARSEAANDTIPTRLDVIARRTEIRRLCIDGIQVLLCGQGGTRDALSRAAAGCARILGRPGRPVAP